MWLSHHIGVAVAWYPARAGYQASVAVASHA